DAFPTITGGMVVTGKKDSKPLIITVTPNSPPQVVSFQGGSYNRPYSIIESYDGNYLLGGLSNDGNGAFIIKITPGGTVLWRNIYSALLQVAGSKRLVALTQLIENADHTISAVGYGASDNLDPGSALGVFMKLSATGEPLSSYSFVTRGLDGFINDIYPRMYETGNQLMISTEEFDTTTGTVQPVLINPEKLGDYCKAFAFTPTVMAMQFSTTTGGTPVTLGVVPAATHPVIVTQNATGGLSVKDLCGLTATSLDVLGSDKGITLQPNPVSANGEVTVKWSHSQLPNGSILLYDVAGRLVKQINVTQGSQATFSTTNLQPGMYMCQLVNAANEKVATQKLLVTE
ncbi:MAG TPA: T9SS type A sorting domain-containing protein, partial [Chitinophagales bacterium]|nr:T9SS type A sorting domain-containing protein [Chitinophagales bacterium]